MIGDKQCGNFSLDISSRTLAGTLYLKSFFTVCTLRIIPFEKQEHAERLSLMTLVIGTLTLSFIVHNYGHSSVFSPFRFGVSPL